MNQADTLTLPSHARVVVNSDVWMEGDSVAQFAKTALLPGCVSAVGMPDLHVGKGPVGAVFAVRDKVYPHLLGGDVGCGVRVFVTGENSKNRDAIERRVHKVWEDEPLADCDGPSLLSAVLRHGVKGLTTLEGVPNALYSLAEKFAEDEGEPGGEIGYLDQGYEQALGSVGGGNHFVEIARVDRVLKPELAEPAGLVRGNLVVIAHSGSRGFGHGLARRWGDATLEGRDIEPYLHDVALARRFAQVNRFVLAYRLLQALGAARVSKIEGTFDVTHNDVRVEEVLGQGAWIHRKGAAPAQSSQLTIVLGSRGAASWVMSGLGNEAGLRSVAHGAGRRMGRAEAREKLKNKYKRSELSTTKVGSRVVCEDADLLYEEHPDAYKPIEPVVASLADAELAEPVASLVPVITVKR
ncbi:MAG: RtcB family protein [Polyangiaceae bacterium]|nr:RtcB family protein [Polyangiaceae bacterium]